MKKNYLILLLIIFSANSFSQSWKKLTFEQYNNSNSKNDLSKYFKKEVPKKLLKNISYPNTLSYLTLSFYINKENEAFGIKINSNRNFKLNKAIIDAFKKYPISNLGIENINKNKIYYFKIISKKGKKNIINCSNSIISKTLPKSKLNSDLEYFEDIKISLERNIRKHFYNKINFSLADNYPIEKQITLGLNIIISKEGVLKLQKFKGTDVFIKNIQEVTNTYPKFDIPAKIDGTSAEHNYNFSLSFMSGDRPTYKETSINYDSIFKANSSNEFAKYLTSKIDKNTLNIANLSRIKKSLTLSFELDKNDKPFNIKTTARSSTLNKKIIEAFKDYPINKLNLPAKSAFNRYFTKILSFEHDKTVFKTNSIIGYEKVPIFPGCKNSKNVMNARSCFSRGVQKHFSKNFDASLPNRLGLSSGKKRILIRFTIAKDGKIKKINVKAPHPKLKEEVTKVMKALPKSEPAIQGGKKVNIKFSIPFTLIIQ